MSQPKKTTDDLTFEDAMGRLEEIVSAMESNRLPLEEMMSGYEEGVRLLRVCRQRIDSARRRVELITADLEGGKATLEPFDDTPGGPGPAPADDPAATHGDDDSARPKTRRRKADADADAEDHDIRLF